MFGGKYIIAAVETSGKVLEGKAPPAVIMQVQNADLLSLHYGIVILRFLNVCVCVCVTEVGCSGGGARLGMLNLHTYYTLYCACV